jgi:peptidoglycan/LPS O-acetylase OafA/YrhL
MFNTANENKELTHPKYRPDIDGLRAIAVLSVVGFHAFGVMGGFTGVDIFFVISGFLISTIIFENLEKKTFSFNEFYQRRIRRIFPSLLLVLVVCLVFGWFVLYPDEYGQLGKHIASGAGFISNLVLWRESGYFDVVAEKKPLLHLWSLGIEEQFYFFWPIFGWLLWKFRIHFLWMAVAIASISFGLNVWLVGTHSIATFYSPLTRFWELLAGGCIAYIGLFNKELLTPVKRNANLFSIIGLIMVIVSVSLLTKDMAFPGWWAALPVIGTSLLIVSGPDSWVSQKVLSIRVLVWFGLISFPLYLWHWPLLTFVRILSDHSRVLIIVSVITSVLLAWLSYRFIERPIRYRKNQTAKTVVLLVMMALVAVCGFITYKATGFEFRIDDGQQGRLLKKYRNQVEWPETYNHTEACTAKYGADQYCLVSDISKPPTAALIGDSHANHFYPGLSEYYKNNGGNLILLGSGGCPPFFEIERVTKPPAANLNCYKRTSGLYKYVLDDKSIKTVFIAFRHSLTFSSDFVFEDKLNQLTLNNNYQSTVDALTRTIQMLEKSGKKVVIIYDTPDLNVDVKACMFERPFQTKGKGCKLNEISVIDDFSVYDRMLFDVEKNTKVQIFDTRPYINGNFPVDADGNLNYRDSTHLSYRGSLYFSDKYNFNE